MRSPTHFARQLKVGDFCLKKRTSFHDSTPEKLSFKTRIDGFKVVSKVATNSFKVVSVISGLTEIHPGDLLIKLRGFDEPSLITLVNSMNSAADRGRARINRPNTRSRATSSAISKAFIDRSNPVFIMEGPPTPSSIFEDLGESNLFDDG